ncbi:hypothetical protein BH11PSE8_BH11PSE8_38420 [soil metagenome]
MPASTQDLPTPLNRRYVGVLIAVCALAVFPIDTTRAQGPSSAVAAVPKSASKPVDEGVSWSELKPAQRAALKPLESEWRGIGAANKRKWIELAARMPNMPANERARIDARMADWARLTPQERGRARLNFEEANQLPSLDRKARWEAYQALSPDQKRALAARATPASGATGFDASRRNPRSDRSGKPEHEASQAKSNIVPNPTFSAPPKPIGPTIQQAQPGATTTLMSRHPAPPPHQQTGMPKIAATPEFVDKSTLLPQRGPQGAAVRQPIAASGAGPSIRR